MSSPALVAESGLPIHQTPPSGGVSIHFYHLTTTPLERALPKLLEKAYGAGFRTLLLVESDERAEQLNQFLWSHDPNSFLPHGTRKEPHPEQQPILISSTTDNKNHANLLFVITGAQVSAADYDRVIDLFDGHNEANVDAARARWKTYKETGALLLYYKQNEAGGWEKGNG